VTVISRSSASLCFPLTPHVYKYLMGRSKDLARLFSVVPSDKTRGSGLKFKYRKFNLKVRNVITVRVVKD